MKYVANWDVEDGYVGKSRPQRTEIRLDDFEDDMTLPEITNRIWDTVQEDFNDRITYHISNVDELAQQIYEELHQRAAEDAD